MDVGDEIAKLTNDWLEITDVEWHPELIGTPGHDRVSPPIVLQWEDEEDEEDEEPFIGPLNKRPDVVYCDPWGWMETEVKQYARQVAPEEVQYFMQHPVGDPDPSPPGEKEGGAK